MNARTIVCRSEPIKALNNDCCVRAEAVSVGVRSPLTTKCLVGATMTMLPMRCSESTARSTRRRVSVKESAMHKLPPPLLYGARATKAFCNQHYTFFGKRFNSISTLISYVLFLVLKKNNLFFYKKKKIKKK